MNVLKFRKIGQELAQTIMKVLLGELHFSHVELPDPSYLVVSMNDSGGFPLCFREDDIHEVLRGGNHLNFLEIVLCHLEELLVQPATRVATLPPGKKRRKRSHLRMTSRVTHFVAVAMVLLEM